MITIDLYFGDGLKGLDILKQNGVFVDVNFSDLPYGTTQCKWDTPIDLVAMWEKLQYIVKPTTPHLLFAQTPFDKVLGCSNLKKLRYEWIWEKSSATGHLNAKKCPMKAHENVLVFYDKSPYYNPQKTNGHTRKVSSAKNRAACIVRRNGTDTVYNDEIPDKVSDYDSTERYPRSVLKFSSDKQKESYHRTQKPVNLIRYFLKTYAKPNWLILDLTYGSGTTAIGCIEEGMNFVGFEDDIDSFQKAIYRIDKHIKDNNLENKVNVNIKKVYGNI